MPALYDYKIEVFIPEELVFPLRDELARIGAGVIGNYDHCIAFSLVRGTWRPLEGANPYNGTIGQISEGTEAKVEVNCKKELVREALQVIRRVHPYDEPLINVIPLANALFE